MPRLLAAAPKHTRWPDRDDLQLATKGRFALYSQTVQMICHQFLANVEMARELRRTHRTIRYPCKDKRFFPLYWPAQSGDDELRRLLQAGQGLIGMEAEIISAATSAGTATNRAALRWVLPALAGHSLGLQRPAHYPLCSHLRVHPGLQPG